MAAGRLSCLCSLAILSGFALAASAARLAERRGTVVKVCGRGFFLSEQNLCLPCSCKGHADRCQDITGVCMDCKDHSTGDFCERCEDGYMMAPDLSGRHTCRPCACPLSTNNFAVYCDRGGSTLRCKCQEGYAGHYCERCSPGYYGNPMAVGSSCRRCECNGNSDPNLIFNECHNVTGHCQHCWANTAGPHCERCAAGFYGDAVKAKNCRECQCNQCGTSSCDDRTGVCHCKPGVTGRLCDRCEEGYSGFSSCQGCRRCECGPASLRSTCHPLTHSCPCRPGAGGRYCERCLPDHWDYGPDGCKKCSCESGHCDMHSGDCLLEARVNLCNISCDECIWHLIGDLRQANRTLDQLRVGVLNISTGAAANDRLKYYNYTALRLQAQFHGWRNKSSVVKVQAAELEEATKSVVSDIKLLRKAEAAAKVLGGHLDQGTLESLGRAERLSGNLSDLNELIEEIIHDWELYSIQQEVDPEEVQQNTQVAQEMVGWMKTVNLAPLEPNATSELGQANDLLRRVRQLEKKLMMTDNRLPAVKEVLARVSDKLSQAQSFLRGALAHVQETSDRNRANDLRVQRSQALQQSLTEEQGAVNRTLQAAGASISDAEAALAHVDALVQNVSQYHAAVDGAGQKLAEKAERLSSVDRELVQRADLHAQDLDEQATRLEEDLRRSDANGFVQEAISAANVYNNIVKYVDDANITSLTTLNLSRSSEETVAQINVHLGQLVKQSDNVFKESVSLHSEQIEVESEVVDKQKYIVETKETMEKNSVKLAELRETVGEIHVDRTPRRLERTLEVAEGTLNRSAEVLQTITPISKKVEKWANNMRNKEYSTTAYEQAVQSAGEAVENLSMLVPELLDKLKVVEEKKPANNVTTNILRIRELIAQARSVAKKVQVSMKFNGQSSVQVHPHSDVEDLKTVTSISLFIRVDPDKDPIEDRFILYLGGRGDRTDYMGLAIKNDNLVYVYNLGGEDVEIPLTSKPVSQWPAVFNYVKVERLGRHGKVFLTIPSQSFTDEQKFIQKGEAPGTDSLFDLDPEDTVFFVGGFPPGFRPPPPLSLAPFVGCIELGSLNNDVISLYNFQETTEMDVAASTPCPRYKLAFSQSRVVSYLFDGTGHALISNMERRGKFGVVTRFDIAVRTVANNGTLFLMVNGDKYFLLELRHGFLRLAYDFGFNGGPKIFESDSPKLQINDARYHEVSVIYHQSKKVILLVDKSHVKSIENPRTTLPFSDIYIGGAPSSVLQSRPELSAVVGLRGCVKGFQFQKKDFNLLEEPGTIGISSGCPEESFMSRQAVFSGEGFLGSTARLSPFEEFEGGLNFRTLQPSGLLFYHSEGPDELSISLENGAVVMSCRGTRLKSHKKQYNDGRTHFLVAWVNGQRCSLLVDDKDRRDKEHPAPAGSAPAGSDTKTFYYGGSPSSTFKNFTGCISYAYINRQDRDIEPEDFQRYGEKVHASLQDCPLQQVPVTVRTRHRESRAKKSESLQDGEGGSAVPLRAAELQRCRLSPDPGAVAEAFRYGGVASSMRLYARPPGSLSVGSRLSLSLRTRSASGLVLYVSDAREHDFMALFLTRGALVFTFTVGEHRVEVRSPEKYNDGSWHQVVLVREGGGRVGRLTVDGLVALEDRVPAASSIGWDVSSPVYVGGVPPGRAEKNIQRSSTYGFTGCVKDLQLDGEPLLAAESFGVTPCFEGPWEEGTFFSAEGGYVVLDQTLDLGPRFQVAVEVRPRVASGLLLHVPSEQGHFTVFIRGGEVVALVRDGAVEFSAKVLPRQSVCDGRWHRITVIRDANAVQLDVDFEVDHVVGPVSPSPAHRSKPVFVGGAPSSLLPEDSAARRPYVGCMRLLLINSSPVSFSKAELVHGAVSVGTCPAA